MKAIDMKKRTMMLKHLIQQITVLCCLLSNPYSSQYWW